MADNFKMEIKGLRQLHDQLTKLDAYTGHKTLNSALRSAAKPAYNRVLANVSFSNNFRESVKLVKHTRMSKRKGVVNKKRFNRSQHPDRAAGVSIAVDFKKAPHFHLLELGTDERKTKKGGYRGRVTPRNYMGKAFQKGHEQEAINIFVKSIQRSLKRLKKQGAF
jgi:HK97 gp10 family phage protein